MSLSKLLEYWLELWPLVIPLAVLLIHRRRDPIMRPIVIYVLVAFVLNAFSTVSFVYHKSMPEWLDNNNLFYHLHSAARVILFSWFILQFMSAKHRRPFVYLVIAYCVLFIVNFCWLESIWVISSRAFAVESAIIYIVGGSFFLRVMNDDGETDWIRHNSFPIIAGVLFYVTITFTIFLFIWPMTEYPNLIWTSFRIYKITYAVLCVLLAVALYRSKPHDQSKVHDKASQDTFNYV